MMSRQTFFGALLLLAAWGLSSLPAVARLQSAPTSPTAQAPQTTPTPPA